MPIKPDFTLILVVYLAIFNGYIKGTILSFALGCFIDILSGSITGLYALLRILTFFLTKLANENFYLKNTLSQIILITFLSIIDGLLLLSIMFIFDSGQNLWLFLAKFIFPQSVLTGLISPIVFFILNRMSPSIEPSR